MINNKRIARLKQDISKKIGNIEYIKFMVEVKEGLFLFNLNSEGNNQIDKYTKLDKPIEGLKIEDFKECSIHDLLIVGDGKTEPVVITDDINEFID